MDISQLPNIDNLLVTADNPPRADLLGVGLDHARCAALHNYLVYYAWLAEGRLVASLHNNANTFFTAHGAEAEALRPGLHPSLTAFLETALLPPTYGTEVIPFFFWANQLSDPDNLIDDQMADLSDQPPGSLVNLYLSNTGQGGEAGGGLFYHQGHHKVAVFMHMDDYDFALPVEKHPELWHPLETVLSNWIEQIRVGKITASPAETPPVFVGEKVGNWEWMPYGEGQVESCLRAWEGLCETVEARMPNGGNNVVTSNEVEHEPEPLLAPAALDAALVLKPSFAHAFLSRARRPRFRYIAPGLTLPPADVSTFAASQPFTRLLRDPSVVPPVRLFPSARPDLTVDLSGWSSPFHGNFRSMSADSLAPSQISVGVYSESIDRAALDSAEEGFRLVLPFGLQGPDGFEPSDADPGARKSDGSGVKRGSCTDLFQHGYKPFGGDYYRPQRLERLLEHWTKMVERGVWMVGEDGVLGDIEMFRGADGEGWRDYVIEPSW
ncbi:uncharacterized protein F4822DRAFT_127714 [Hypoxylon trugodes]|uniref:uncharacterized protein n=1 Tax=Hypoxylon trugodes TaxID=326681 RepID=UPI002198DB9B|nr:uncharacterized protein F4822DRAFT_127714 [Hypoxylon trugodes]KAI1392390.1 hypothetical protein F4822DRAFT_127714 [Hypoxylon trugodes]